MRYILLFTVFISLACQKNSEFVISKEKKVAEKDLNLKQTKEEILSGCADFLKHKNSADFSAIKIEKKLLELIEKGLNDNFKDGGSLPLKKLLSEIEDINRVYEELSKQLSQKLNLLDKTICETFKK